MAKKLRPVLIDILTAVEGIEQAVAGRSYEEFHQSWVLRHAVQRGIEIISEAVRRLPNDLLLEHSQIAWPSIKAIGNILRHEYHTVRDTVIWNVVETHLPPLKRAILAMLGGLTEKA